LPECRLYGGDLGVHFFTSNVNDALRCLRALNKAAPAMPTGQRSLCDRLLDRIELLKREEPLRAQILNELDGPETLLHGDLWTTNTFVTHSEDGSHARLIDWDHAAAGPASYDLSTFLLRFPRRYRARIFDHYVKAARRMDWALAPREEINFLFETAELARIANRIIWPAIAVLQDGAGWGIEMLAEIERWFESMDRLFFEYERTDGKETMAV
jgi:thiamine kinase-like enzyme